MEYRGGLFSLRTIYEKTYSLLIEKLKAERKLANLTQLQLAELLQRDQSYISKYERSERRLDVIELRDICKAMNISFIDFFTEFETQLNNEGLE